MKKVFTILELLVVVAIIAILAVSAIPNFVGRIQDAENASWQAEVDSVYKAVSEYYIDNGEYPTLQNNQPNFGDPKNIKFAALVPEYMTKLPSFSYWWVDYSGKVYHTDHKIAQVSGNTITLDTGVYADKYTFGGKDPIETALQGTVTVLDNEYLSTYSYKSRLPDVALNFSGALEHPESNHKPVGSDVGITLNSPVIVSDPYTGPGSVIFTDTEMSFSVSNESDYDSVEWENKLNMYSAGEVVVKARGIKGAKQSDWAEIRFTVLEASLIADIQISNYTTYILMKSGDLYSFGDNSRGQLGNGTLVGSHIPYKMASNVKKVRASLYHVVLLTTSGELRGCGYNYFRQISSASTGNITSLVTIAEDVKEIGLSAKNTYFTDSSDNLYGIGSHEYGIIPGETAYVTSPKIITTDVKSIHGGVDNLFVIKNDGNTYAVGRNLNGSITGIDSTVVTNITLIGSGFTDVTTSNTHTLLIKNNSELWGIGKNVANCMGNTLALDSITPLVKLMDNVKSVSICDSRSAVVTNDNILLVAGENNYKSLANIDNNTLSSWTTLSSATKAFISGGNLLYMNQNGQIMGRGSNEYGQLAQPLVANNVFESVQNTNISDIQPLGSGLLILYNNGELRYFGIMSNISSLIYRTADPILLDTDVRSIEDSLYTANAAFYIKTNGDLYSIGAFNNGKRGEATSKEKAFVASNVKQAFMGENHSAYVTNSGELFTSGLNSFGQLGNGNKSDLAAFTRVRASGVKEVSLGSYHTAVLTTGNELIAVGSNNSGRLGLTTTTTEYTTWQSVATGVTAGKALYQHTVWSKGNIVYGCGVNNNGELGSIAGTVIANKTTQIFSANNSVTGIYGQALNTFLVDSDGKVYASGSNGTAGKFGPMGLPDNQKQFILLGDAVQKVKQYSSYALYTKTNGSIQIAGTKTGPIGWILNRFYNYDIQINIP